MTQLVTTTDYHTGIKPMPVAQGAEVLCIRDSATFATTKSINDLLALMPLPADHVPVHLILDSTDGDTGTSAALSVGLLNAGKTDLSTLTADGGAVWIDGGTGIQTAVINVPTTNAIYAVKPSRSTRYIGVKLKTNGSATAATVGVTLFYRAAAYEPYDS